MRLILLLCLVSCSTAVFNAKTCLEGFEAIQSLLVANQKKLGQLCATEESIAQTKTQFLDILKLCGLDDWKNGDDLKNRQIGAIVTGLVDYFTKFLCTKEEDFYCFPAAVRMIDLTYLIPLFGEQEFDISKLDLKCYAMGGSIIKLVCPNAAANTPQKKCQVAMVRYFDEAVWTIKSLLSAYAPADVNEVVMPLLRFATDVRFICRPNARAKALLLEKKNCVNDAEPKFNLPCLREEKFSDDCIREQICTLDADEACNKIQPATLQILAAHKSGEFSTGEPKFTLKDGTELTLARAKTICQIKSTGCAKKKKRTVDIEIIRDGRDLYKEYQYADDATKKKWAESICLDQQVKDGEFLAEECQVIFKEGRNLETNNRRLLVSSKTVVASVTVETDNTDPVTCDDTGSYFTFDNVLNSNSVNSTGVTVQVNCTEGDESIDPLNPTPKPSDFPDSGAMQLSTSIIGLLCFIFALYDM